MKAYAFNNTTADMTKRFGKKEAWLHVLENEPRFKANPCREMYLENTPRKNHGTAVCVPFVELKKIMEGKGRRKKRQAQ